MFPKFCFNLLSIRSKYTHFAFLFYSLNPYLFYISRIGIANKRNDKGVPQAFKSWWYPRRYKISSSRELERSNRRRERKKGWLKSASKADRNKFPPPARVSWWRNFLRYVSPPGENGKGGKEEEVGRNKRPFQQPFLTVHSKQEGWERGGQESGRVKWN